MKKIFLFALTLMLLIAPAASASESAKIVKLEKRIIALENEIARIKKQEARASKYLQCIQKVEGNSLTVPFKILNCIRK
jgi:hypothetical protein